MDLHTMSFCKILNFSAYMVCSNRKKCIEFIGGNFKHFYSICSGRKLKYSPQVEFIWSENLVSKLLTRLVPVVFWECFDLIKLVFLPESNSHNYTRFDFRVNDHSNFNFRWIIPSDR